MGIAIAWDDCLRTLKLGCLITAGLLLGAGCSDDPSTATDDDDDDPEVSTPFTPVAETVTYGGPGSEWNMTLEPEGDCTITRAPDFGEDIDLTVQCEWEQLETGFMKFEVVSSEGEDGPEPGDEALGLVVDGFVSFLKPSDQGSELIPMLAKGNCPTTARSYNWFTTDASGRDLLDHDVFGVATLDPTDDFAIDITDKWNLQTPFGEETGGESPTGGTCENGIVELDQNVTMWANQVGGFIVQAEGVIVAMPQSQFTLDDLDGNYVGLVFDEGNDEDPVQAVRASIDSEAEEMTANVFTDVETGAVDESFTATIGDLNAGVPTDGFLEGTLTVTGEDGSSHIVCSPALDIADSGKNMLFCVGHGLGNTSYLFNLIFVSVD